MLNIYFFRLFVFLTLPQNGMTTKDSQVHQQRPSGKSDASVRTVQFAAYPITHVVPPNPTLNQKFVSHVHTPTDSNVSGRFPYLPATPHDGTNAGVGVGVGATMGGGGGGGGGAIGHGGGDDDDDDDDDHEDQGSAFGKYTAFSRTNSNKLPKAHMKTLSSLTQEIHTPHDQYLNNAEYVNKIQHLAHKRDNSQTAESRFSFFHFFFFNCDFS